MTTQPSIPTQPVAQSRLPELDLKDLEFGKVISDHMIVADYKKGAWVTPEIVPYGEMSFTPAMMALHYGQSVFEGMKAFRMKDGNVCIFRPQKHLDRLNKSLNRMCMPEINQNLFITSLHELIKLDEKWIPNAPGYSLYIRPLVFATELRLGVKVSDEYKFVIMTSPVGPYHNKPFRLKVEHHFVRTAEGGTGFAKCAGNYGGAYYPVQLARKEGFDQVLWTDHKEHLYIDEVGMMNVMFVINNKIITPKLNTAILDGVTRDSVIVLAKEMGLEVEERKVSIREIEKGLNDSSVTEVFGVGTAAVVAPVSVIHINGKDLVVREPGTDSVQHKLKLWLEDIRLGVKPDTDGWNHIIQVD